MSNNTNQEEAKDQVCIIYVPKEGGFAQQQCIPRAEYDKYMAQQAQNERDNQQKVVDKA